MQHFIRHIILAACFAPLMATAQEINTGTYSFIATPS